MIQGEQEHAGKEEAHSSTFLSRAQWSMMNPAPLEKVLRHMANTDRNYGLP